MDAYTQLLGLFEDLRQLHVDTAATAQLVEEEVKLVFTAAIAAMLLGR